MRRVTKHVVVTKNLVITAALLIYSAVPLFNRSVSAFTSNIIDRSLKISDSVSGASNVRYLFSFTTTTPALLGSIELELCSNDPFPGTPCSAPVGLDMSAATLQTQTGLAGFSIHPNSTTNKIILTRAPVLNTLVPSSYEFSGISNPSTSFVTLYGRIRTFTSVDATTGVTDFAGLAWFVQPALSISTEVPPTLDMCVGVVINGPTCAGASGAYIDLGTFSSTSTSTGTSEMMVATNAQYGYSVTMVGTTLTAGNVIIPSLPTQTASQVGTSQFGINLVKNTNPSLGVNPGGVGSALPHANYNVPNQFRFASGDFIVNHSGPDGYSKFTLSYITNVSSNQPAGVYATTLSFICLASF